MTILEIYVTECVLDVLDSSCSKSLSRALSPYRNNLNIITEREYPLGQGLGNWENVRERARVVVVRVRVRVVIDASLLRLFSVLPKDDAVSIQPDDADGNWLSH